MSESDYSPNDPEFLASCGVDGPLSDDERDRLAGALRDSDSLARFKTQIGDVDRLVKHWSKRGAELDWDAHAALIRARISEDDEAGLHAIDALVSDWAPNVPRIDERRFTAAVFGRIQDDGRSRRWRRAFFRIGTPLAAAATIAIVVSAWFWRPLSRQPVVSVVYQMPTEGSSRSAAAAQAIVRFDRNAPEGFTNNRPPSVSILAMGSSPLDTMPEEVPPL